MQKIGFLLFFLSLFSLSAFSQSGWEKFKQIEKVKSADPQKLAQEITAPFDNELDKIKAIYYWTTHNIAYDYGIIEARAKEKGKRQKYTAAELKQRRDDYISSTLKRKKGVCQHYSLVFAELCTQAGIEAAFVGGKVKTKSGKTNSHAWNAVKYQGEWKLIDATYGSGSLNRDKKFVRRFMPGYFFTEPEVFAVNHLPKDDSFQLTDTKITEAEFVNFPSIGRAFLEYGVTNLSHNVHKIKVNPQENLVIKFTVAKPLDNFLLFKPSNGKRIDLKLENEGLNYTVTVAGADLRNGYYHFSTGTDTFFSYKIERG